MKRWRRAGKKKKENQKKKPKKSIKPLETLFQGITLRWGFFNELKSTGTIDFIVENENATLVLYAQEKYLSNDNISELLGGRFKVLGKIIKICHDENEKSIYLGKPVWEY